MSDPQFPTEGTPTQPAPPAAVAPPVAHAPNGWYQVADGRMRWWNETGWTDSYQQAPVPIAEKPPKVRRRIPLGAGIGIAAGALVLGIIIGSASGHAAPTNVSGLKDQVSDLKSSNSTLQGQVESLTADKAQLQSDNDQLTLDAAKAADTAAANTIPGDGTYLVGTDIKPGTYRSIDNSGCYWERDKSADGSFGSIIANDNVDGQGVVTIKSSDKVFTSSGCSDWKRVGH
jgi:hypothetical protein